MPQQLVTLLMDSNLLRKFQNCLVPLDEKDDRSYQELKVHSIFFQQKLPFSNKSTSAHVFLFRGLTFAYLHGESRTETS